jgi:SpoVK/Ycf46/Vps4 family AAA+-type ATPase
VPVDVDEEISLASGMVWFATLRQNGAKFAIMLSTAMIGADYDDDFESRRATQKLLMVSIACREKAIADHFFEQIEQRRRTLSVYRGKVIDPDVHGGGIHGIGFRAIKRVTEENLVLPDSVKQLLHNAIVGFYNHADTLRSVGVEMKRGVLFHSPPGTGKTSISLYLAGLLPNFTVCFVSGQKLLYPREICRMARYLQPAMVVFEDIDLVAEERDSNGLATVLGELMNQIDGCDPDEQVLFIMNTNSLQRLEGAVRNRPGRVDQIIDIPLPDADARRRLFQYFARGPGLPERLSPVLQATDGATPATLKEIVKRATVAAIERGAGNGTGSIQLTESELLLATKQVQVMRDTKPAGKMGFV